MVKSDVFRGLARPLEAADDGATDSADTPTPAQRRLDALVSVGRHYLDTAATPVTGGERPHLGVILDLASLEGRAGRRWTASRSGWTPAA